jgi:ribonuclease BN (tRNA processing enzyme)
MRNLGAAIDVVAVDAERNAESPRFDVEGVRMRGHLNPHGTTTALAYRIEENGRSLVYASDAGYPPGDVPASAIEFYRGASVLVHDCTYSPEDRAGRLGRGFSSVAEAAQAAVRAGVGHLVMTHYDQDYGDDLVDALAERTRRLLDEQGGREIALTAAREGLTLRV